MNTLHHWGLALSGVFAIAMVMAVSGVVRAANEGAVLFASGLAYLGYTVLAISHFRSLAVYPTLAEWYVAGDASVQAGIGAAGYLINLDPQGWLGFGGPGLWALVINLLALEKGIWPKALAYVGIGTGILAWLVVAGNVFEIPLLIAIA